MVRVVIFLLTAALLSPLCQAFDQLEMTVDRNPVIEGEAFTLQLNANDALDNDQFDSSPLLKQGFIVGTTSVSRKIRTINGQTEKGTIWSTTLVAPKAGQYILPGITIDGITSKPIQLTVTEKSNASAATQNQQQVELSTSLDKTSALPGEMLLYTVKLTVSTELSRDTQLSEPKLDGATIFQIGDQQQNSEIINGRRVAVLTRQYGVMIADPGSYQIKGPVLDGQMVVQTGSGYYSRQRLEPILLNGDDRAVEIAPLPASLPKGILVAPFVSLNEQWQPDESSIKAGDAITRTITLTVANQHQDHLPELKLPYPQTVRHYADANERKQLIQGQTPFAQLIQKEAIIATEPGKLVLPEYTLPWYNSKTQKIEYARLPARTITVQPSAKAPSEPAPITNLPQQLVQNGVSPLWQAGTLLFALLWLLTLLLWLWREKHRGNLKIPEQAQSKPNEAVVNDSKLKAALHSADNSPLNRQTAAMLHKMVLQWAQAHHLKELAGYEELKPWLSTLQETGWAAIKDESEDNFDGRGFYLKLMEIKNRKEVNQTDKLNPL